MFPLLKTVSYISSFFLVIILIFPGCTFYRTISVDPITPQSVSTIYSPDKIFVIHNDRESEEYLFTDVKIENDKLKGVIESAPRGTKHPDHKKSFLRSKAKAYEPLKVVHIYTSIRDISPGSFEVSINDIRFLEVHKKNKLKSGLMTVVTVVTTAAAVVGTYFIIALYALGAV